MSVVVALQGSDAAVVASDGRRFEPNGEARDDYSKAFRIPTVGVLGGHVGLLEFAGQSIPAWLQAIALADVATLDEFALAAQLLLETEMTRIPDGEVALQHRVTDIVLVGHSQLQDRQSPTAIRAVVLRPDTDAGCVRGEIREFVGYCVAGDDDAQAAIHRYIATLGLDLQGLQNRRLQRQARTLISVGIQASGDSPHFPGVASCGGPASLVVMT